MVVLLKMVKLVETPAVVAFIEARKPGVTLSGTEWIR